MKIRFLQIIASSAVWMSCHAPAGVASVAPKWEQLQDTNSALLRVRVALEPKCTLKADSCDNDKISTFFNASSSPIIQALSVFFLR